MRIAGEVAFPSLISARNRHGSSSHRGTSVGGGSSGWQRRARISPSPALRRRGRTPCGEQVSSSFFPCISKGAWRSRVTVTSSPFVPSGVEQGSK
nr:hypothetical protein Itr_chr08CG14380 [Ipomoea trifida]